MGVPYGCRAPIGEILLWTLVKPVEFGVGGLVTLLEKALSNRGVSVDKYPARYAQDTLCRMLKTGLVKVKIRGDKTEVSLTTGGYRRLSELKHHRWRVEQPKAWNGKWHILIFDIEEVKRGIRDRLRRELRYQGFMRLQDSVWVHAYDCTEFITLLLLEFLYFFDDYARVAVSMGDTSSDGYAIVAY